MGYLRVSTCVKVACHLQRLIPEPRLVMFTVVLDQIDDVLLLHGAFLPLILEYAGNHQSCQWDNY